MVLKNQTFGRLLFLLFLVNFLNFFDRALPAVVLEPIRQEFSLSDTLLGVLGTAFVVIYAIAGIPLGRLADTQRRTAVLGFGVALWSLLTAATGMVKNFASLLVVRLGVGVGEASCAPAANSLIADICPSEKRGRALGLFMLGLPLGTLASFSLGGWLADTYGWRVPFFAAAIPGIVIALLLWRSAEPVRGLQESYQVGSQSVTRPFRSLARITTLWWLIASGAALNFAAYSLNTFLSVHMIRFHHSSISEAGVVSAVVLGATGVVSLSVGGWIADFFHRHWGLGRLMLGAIGLLVAAPLSWIGLSQSAGNVLGVTIFLSLAWLFFFLYYVTVYPSIHDVVEPRLRASGMAMYFLFMYVLGGGFGTVVTGFLSDFFANQTMLSAGATHVNDVMRAEGLRKALLWILPSALSLAGLTILGATLSYRRDKESVALIAI